MEMNEITNKEKPFMEWTLYEIQKKCRCASGCDTRCPAYQWILREPDKRGCMFKMYSPMDWPLLNM